MRLGKNTGDGAGLWVAFLLIGMLVFFSALSAAPAFAKDTRNCDDFASQEDAQAELNGDSDDPNNLDADGDEQACEDFDYGDDQYADDQDGGDDQGTDDDQYADDEASDDNEKDGNCENAQEVDTFEGSPGEDFVTDPFRITSEQFRVSFDNDETGFVFADIEILDDDDKLVDSFITGGEGQQDSLIVNGGPGDFVLDVTADTDDPFTVSVESCGDTGGDDNDGDADDSANDGDTDGDDNDGDANDDGVIDDTVPDKDLPNTGGFPLIIAGGSALLSACGVLAAWRSKARER